MKNVKRAAHAALFILVQVFIENISIHSVMADLFRHPHVNNKEGMPEQVRHDNFTT